VCCSRARHRPFSPTPYCPHQRDAWRSLPQGFQALPLAPDAQNPSRHVIRPFRRHTSLTAAVPPTSVATSRPPCRPKAGAGRRGRCAGRRRATTGRPELPAAPSGLSARYARSAITLAPGDVHRRAVPLQARRAKHVQRKAGHRCLPLAWIETQGWQNGPCPWPDECLDLAWAEAMRTQPRRYSQNVAASLHREHNTVCSSITARWTALYTQQPGKSMVFGRFIQFTISRGKRRHAPTSSAGPRHPALGRARGPRCAAWPSGAGSDVAPGRWRARLAPAAPRPATWVRRTPGAIQDVQLHCCGGGTIAL